MDLLRRLTRVTVSKLRGFPEHRDVGDGHAGHAEVDSGAVVDDGGEYEEEQNADDRARRRVGVKRHPPVLFDTEFNYLWGGERVGAIRFESFELFFVCLRRMMNR